MRFVLQSREHCRTEGSTQRMFEEINEECGGCLTARVGGSTLLKMLESKRVPFPASDTDGKQVTGNWLLPVEQSLMVRTLDCTLCDGTLPLDEHACTFVVASHVHGAIDMLDQTVAFDHAAVLFGNPVPQLRPCLMQDFDLVRSDRGARTSGKGAARTTALTEVAGELRRQDSWIHFHFRNFMHGTVLSSVVGKEHRKIRKTVQC